jgi:hypothetical protein
MRSGLVLQQYETLFSLGQGWLECIICLVLEVTILGEEFCVYKPEEPIG